MKAYVVNQWGDADNLQLTELPVPRPQAGEVCIRVKAIGFNPMDSIIRKGLWKYGHLTLPARLGWDIAGIVEAVGPEVSSLKVGDEVAGLINFPSLYNGWEGRGYAEFACAPAGQLAIKPASVSFAEAAALPVAGLTAAQAFAVADPAPGSTVLVHGAAGGVGHILVQLAKQSKMHVIATASGAHREFVQKLGADETIDYKIEPFEHKVQSADAIFDTVGGETFARSIALVRPGGALVSTLWPSISGPVRDTAEKLGLRTEKIIVQQLRLSDNLPITTAVVLVHPDTDMLTKLLKLMDTGKLHLNIDKQFAFTDLPQAHTYIETQSVAGKVVVVL